MNQGLHRICHVNLTREENDVLQTAISRDLRLVEGETVRDVPRTRFLPSPFFNFETPRVFDIVHVVRAPCLVHTAFSDAVVQHVL